MKKLLLIISILALFLFPLSGIAGTYTPEAYWTLTNGVLTITVDGTMRNFNYNVNSVEMKPPWMNHRSQIRAVVLDKDVLSVGSYAFYECTVLESVSLDALVSQIEEFAFCGCSKLTTINSPSRVSVIGESAFEGCSSLTDIRIPSGVSIINEKTFLNCTGLTRITIP